MSCSLAPVPVSVSAFDVPAMVMVVLVLFPMGRVPSVKDKVSILAAVDGPALPDFLEYGAHGALIGISTVATPLWVALLEASAAGNKAQAMSLMQQCAPIMESVWENHHFKRPTSEVASHKEALVQLGELPSSRVRQPSVGVTPEVREEIRVGLLAAGLLKEKIATPN
jgi:4-hydroxy-tetrahydrodipicolinate synthase